MSTLLDSSICNVQAGLEKKLFTIGMLTDVYLKRIQEASEFCAILETNPDAIRIADDLDKELENGNRRR